MCLYPRQELNSRGIAAGQLSVKERWQFKYTPLSQSKVEQFYFFSITSANGSAATDLRWGGSFELDFLCRSLPNLTVKIIMKICPLLSWSYCKNKSGLLLFSETPCIICVDSVYLLIAVKNCYHMRRKEVWDGGAKPQGVGGRESSSGVRERCPPEAEEFLK